MIQMHNQILDSTDVWNWNKNTNTTAITHVWPNLSHNFSTSFHTCWLKWYVTRLLSASKCHSAYIRGAFCTWHFWWKDNAIHIEYRIFYANFNLSQTCNFLFLLTILISIWLKKSATQKIYQHVKSMVPQHWVLCACVSYTICQSQIRLIFNQSTKMYWYIFWYQMKQLVMFYPQFHFNATYLLQWFYVIQNIILFDILQNRYMSIGEVYPYSQSYIYIYIYIYICYLWI